MNNVVKLSDHDPREGSWLSGPAHCLICKETWHEARRTDAKKIFDCQACGREAGIYSGLMVPCDGRERLSCEGCEYQL